MVAAVALALHVEPLNGPWYWQWPWRRIDALRIVPAMALAALPFFAAQWLRARGTLGDGGALALVALSTFLLEGVAIAIQGPGFELGRIVFAVQHPVITSYFTDAMALDGVAASLARQLSVLDEEGPASVLLDVLLGFLRAHQALLPASDPLRERHLRARAAIHGALQSLRDAHAQHDDPRGTLSGVAATIHRWIEGQTFAPRAGTAGLHLVDAQAARYGDFTQSLVRVRQLVAVRRPLLVFPEGTRSASGQLQPFKAGVGLLACELDVPVVPVHIAGTQEALPKGTRKPARHPLRLLFGEALEMAPFKGRDGGLSPYEIYREIAAALKRRIEALGRKNI